MIAKEEMPLSWSSLDQQLAKEGKNLATNAHEVLELLGKNKEKPNVFSLELRSLLAKIGATCCKYVQFAGMAAGVGVTVPPFIYAFWEKFALNNNNPPFSEREVIIGTLVAFLGVVATLGGDLGRRALEEKSTELKIKLEQMAQLASKTEGVK